MVYDAEIVRTIADVLMILSVLAGSVADIHTEVQLLYVV